MSVACAVLLAPVASAGDWTITPSASVSETVTDNIRQTNKNAGQDSDFITQISPGIAVNGSGGRTSLSLNYSYDQIIHKNATDLDTSHHNLAANGNAELYDRVIFVDGGASISRQLVASGRGSASNTVAAKQANHTTVSTFNFSPYFLHHFGTWVETESRTTIDRVQTESAVASNTTTISESVTASSGRRFTQFLWDLSIDRSKTIYSDGPSRKSMHGDADLTYVLSRKISLLGGLGYEDFTDTSLSGSPTGITWRAGADYRPGPRTSLHFVYGKRFDTDTIDFTGSYDLSERTSINVAYSETITTSQDQIRTGANNFIVDPTSATGYRDTRSGLPALPIQTAAGIKDIFTGDTWNTTSFGLQDDSFLQKRFTIGMNGSRKRNSFGGSAFWESRFTEKTGITETQFGASANFSRQLSRRTDGTIVLNYNNTDFGDAAGRVDDDISTTLGLSYKIFRETSANLSYTFTRTFSSEGSANELSENTVTLSLTKTF